MAKPLSKWKFAIGTTSRVPGSGGVLHYLIADFDGSMPQIQIYAVIDKNLIVQRTPHGWHLYSDRIMSFECLCNFLGHIGADPNWIRIGKERGYFFLADKQEIDFPWPVEHMVLHYAKTKERKARNTPASGQVLRKTRNHKGDV
jgi:hypothetical protein